MSEPAPGAVLVTRRIPAAPLERLRAAPELGELRLNPHDRPLTRAELLEQVRGCACLASQLVDRVDDEVLAAAGPGLRLVANFAVGLDNVDVAACTARGVAVCNTPDVLTECTADLTWALILGVARRLEGDRAMRAGEFPGWSPLYMLGGEVSGKTLGVVGLGRIGAAVARRGRGFGMRLLYAGPHDKPAAAELGARRVPLDELLAESDFVSLHCALTPETRHLIDAARLARMRPSAYLINVARGPVVDEEALVEALRAGRLAGAGLDVHEDEPRAAPGLVELPNTLLLPHVGSATHETRDAMGQRVVDAVLAGLRGEAPPHCVNPESQ